MNQSRADWGSVTAILGGTFDPPHLGHLEVARGLAASPGVRRVVILPSGIPNWKQATTKLADRESLLHLAFDDEFTIDWHDWQQSQKLGRPIRTWESIGPLQQKWGRIAWVIGSDQIAQLDQWDRFPDVLKQCDWIWVERQGDEIRKKALERFSLFEASGLLTSHSHSQWRIAGGDTFLIRVATGAAEISSTKIRETIALTGMPPDGMLSHLVTDAIQSLGMYGCSPNPNQRMDSQKRKF